jgi:hypothetical protein
MTVTIEGPKIGKGRIVMKAMLFVCVIFAQGFVQGAAADVGCSCLSRADEITVRHIGMPPIGSHRLYKTKFTFKPQTASFTVESNYESGLVISTREKISYDADTMSRMRWDDNLLSSGKRADYSSAYAEGQIFVGRLLAEIDALVQIATMVQGNATEATVGQEAIDCAVYRLTEIQKKAVIEVIKRQEVRVGQE